MGRCAWNQHKPQRALARVTRILSSPARRAFDHYYGMHQGVRGFNDRAAIQLPSGLPAFYQPVNSNLSEYMLPFHVDSMTTSATCMDAPTMDYPHDIGIINHGRYDACEDFFTRGLARPSLSPASRHPPSHPSALPVYPFGREYGARGGHGDVVLESL